MSEEHQLPSDSDEDDEDYVPDGAEQAGSEAESEGEIEEDSGAEDENDENEQVSKKQKKRGRKGNKSKGSKRKKIESKDVDDEDEEDKSEKKIVSEEEEKLRADSLWADFMKDTGKIIILKLTDNFWIFFFLTNRLEEKKYMHIQGGHKTGISVFVVRLFSFELLAVENHLKI